MNTIAVFFESLYGVIKTFGIADLIDVLLVSFLLYKGIMLVRETRAQQLVKGILLLGVCYVVAIVFRLPIVKFLMENVFQIGIIALIVLFQPELRRMLERVGRTQVSAFSMFNPDLSGKKHDVWEKAIRQICEAVDLLHKDKTGALLVIERQTKLGEQIATGVELNAAITVELLLNIFFVNTPLHDGAVIIRDGRIFAAACFLPKPQKEELIATKLGSRHRAAIGISEISDSITIVVSEETGTISVAEDGQLTRDFTKETLHSYLMEALIPQKETENSIKKTVLSKTGIFRRTKNDEKNH